MHPYICILSTTQYRYICVLSGTMYVEEVWWVWEHVLMLCGCGSALAARMS